MQQPKYSPEDEQLLMSQLWSPHLRDNPEAFVLFVFPWGKKNTPLEKHRGPRRWQRDILREITAHIKANNGQLSPEDWEVFRDATASGRGPGKSALVSWLGLWMLSTRIGSSVIVSANSENQLRTVTWGELNKWSAMIINAHWWEISATKLVPAAWLTELVERDLKKGTRYWAAEGKLWSEENPDGYAGPHNHDGMMVIFDEASGIPDAIWPVAAGYFTEPILDRYWFAFSNPRRNTGYFFECFGSRRKFWNTRQIDSRTVEGVDKKIYEEIIEEYGEDSIQARVEVYGEFPVTGEDQFIPPYLVDDAFKRDFYKDMTAPLVIGVDPARGGRDTTVIAIRRGRDLVELRRYKKDDLMEIVGLVINAIEDYQPDLTVIDEGGLGYGVLDRLKEQRYKVRGVNFGWSAKNPKMWSNKPTELWGLLREWLKTASILPDKQLKNQLVSRKRTLDSTGAELLETKKQMKTRGVGSPDDVDAIAVTFAFPIARRESTTRERRNHLPSDKTSVSTSWMSS
ncbi:hypothetical protein LCGC14_0886560 [marine sediment metagenome]|uniref:Terminase large subunit gp17-like C-terminal domain-containing protein n=1 Tax=marine sediment metagenome TaxID=412755 RepID=A0A0F9P5C5_9ZZZZ